MLCWQCFAAAGDTAQMRARTINTGTDCPSCAAIQHAKRNHALIDGGGNDNQLVSSQPMINHVAEQTQDAQCLSLHGAGKAQG